MPPIRLFYGSRDALGDSSLKFMDKLLEHNQNVKVYVFKEMYHGFLNYGDYKGFGLSEAKIAIELIGLKMNDFFKGKLRYQKLRKKMKKAVKIKNFEKNVRLKNI